MRVAKTRRPQAASAPSPVDRSTSPPRRNPPTAANAPTAVGSPADRLSTPHRVSLAVAPAWRIVPATPRDHAQLQQMLKQSQRRVPTETFDASLEDPRYTPSDRLLLKSGESIVGHVQALVRDATFGSSVVRVGVLRQLALRAEWHCGPAGPRLVGVAEQQLRRRGCALAFAATNLCEPLIACDWADGAASGCLQANPREVLAKLYAQRKICCRRRKYGVRVWRQVELDDLSAIYDRRSVRLHGPLVRTESDWQWLISRRAFAQIAVAVSRRPALPADDTNRAAVPAGYVVLDGDRVVEIMTLPGRRGASAALAEWACQEAIERGSNSLLVDLPVGDPAQNLLLGPGSVRLTGDVDGRKRLVKILDHQRLTASLAQFFCRRAKRHGLKQGGALTVELDGIPCRLVVTPDGVEWQTPAAGRCDMVATSHGWTRLMLAGRVTGCDVRLIHSSPRKTEAARGLARALFQGQALWWSALEDRTVGH